MSRFGVPARVVTYWPDQFSPTTWQEFLDAGGTVSGFRKNREASVMKIQPGDFLLCYFTGLSRESADRRATHPRNRCTH